ncbi:MAG TPA: PAS domain S-box protein [Smithella sp.]|nr:PAS domain S-box protein [Smithella sp.]
MEAVKKILGYKVEDRIGDNAFKNIHPDDLPLVVNSLNRLIADKNAPPQQDEIRIRHIDGNWRYFESMANNLKQDNGAEAIIVNLRDISDRKQAEESIKKASNEWQATFDAVNDAICLIDVDQRIIRCNRTMSEMFAIPQEELIGKHCWEIVHATKEPVPECPVIKIKSSLRREEMELYREGKWLNITAYPVLNDNHVLAGMVHIIKDITEHKRSDEALLRSEEDYRTLFEQSVDGIIIIAESGIVMANNAYCVMRGLPLEKILGTKPLDILHPEDRKIAEQKMKKMRSGEPAPEEGIYRAIRLDGSVAWVNLRSKLIEWKGKPAFQTIVRNITDRKHAEEELKKALLFNEAIIDSIPGIVYLYDDTGRLVHWNRKSEEVTGYSGEELKGRHALAFFSGRDMSIIKQGIAETMTSGHSSVEASMITKDGRSIPMIFTGVKLSIANQDHLLGIGIDITNAKRAQEALRESEEKFRILTQSSPTAILLYQDNKWIYANSAASQITGYTNQELMNMNFWDMVHPDDKQLVRERGQKRQRAEDVTRRYEFKIISKGGTVKWVDLSGETIVINGQPAGIISVLDITERKIAEEELKESEERYRTFFNTSRDCVFISSLDGHWINMNDAAIDLFGYSSRDELMQVNISDLYVKAQDRAKYINTAIEHGTTKDYPVDLLRKNGEVIHTLITSAVRYDTKGNVIGLMGTIKDITERKKAEDEIRRLNESLEQRVRERTTELEAFSYSVSHDLRAPLRAIDGFSQALLDDYETKLDLQGRDYLARIRTSTRLMAELIEDLLKLSRITRTDMDIVPLNLTRMARAVIDELQKSHPRRIANIKIADTLEDFADPRLIRIVLENLLGNAWKFTGKKPVAEIEFGSIKKNNKKIYFIRDNGAGFDMEYAEKLFAPFQRLHNVEEYPGTGIGLATVKRIIHRHGGTVWAEGLPGQGATFYFTLQE